MSLVEEPINTVRPGTIGPFLKLCEAGGLRIHQGHAFAAKVGDIVVKMENRVLPPVPFSKIQ